MQTTPHVRPSLRPEYSAWSALRRRLSGDPKFPLRWNSFSRFVKDVGERPPGRQFRLLDPAKGFSPDNVGWVTPPPPKPAREPTTAGTRRNPTAKRRFSTVTVPPHAGPHVRLVFSEMRRQCVTYDKLEERSGILRATIKAWRHKNSANLATLEAVLNTLGFHFLPVPHARVLPAGMVADLEAVAAKYGQELAPIIAE